MQPPKEIVLNNPVAFCDMVAEQSCLGAMLLDNNRIAEVRALLTADDFALQKHARLFKVIEGMADSGDAVDTKTLPARMRTAGCYEECGGSEYLVHLMDEVPAAANWATYGRIVKERAQARRLAEHLTRELGDLQAGHACQDSAERLTGLLADLGRDAGVVTVPLREALKQHCDAIDALARGERPLTVKSGFSAIDDLTGGFGAGRLVVVASRPGMGKTTLLSNIALSVARSRGLVLFFSLEMSPAEIAANMSASLGNVNLHTVHSRRLAESEWQGLAASVSELAAMPVVFVQQRRLSAARVGPLALLAARGRSIGLIVVDYLGLLAMPRRERRDLEIGEATRELKITAGELGCPVLCAAQLNRQSENREDRRPRLSDLRDSGLIEADADMALLLHRPCANISPAEQEARAARGKPSRDDYGLVYCEKNRTGPTGRVTLGWDGAHARFTNAVAPDVLGSGE